MPNPPKQKKENGNEFHLIEKPLRLDDDDYDEEDEDEEDDEDYNLAGADEEEKKVY